MEIIGQTHVFQDQPNRIKKPEYDKWEDFANKQRQIAPPGMNNFYQTTGIVWALMPTED